MERFYGHGKLLLTGEYAVLDGALALALPTKLGQGMTVKLGSQKGLTWKSFDRNTQIWYENEFTIEWHNDEHGISGQLLFDGTKMSENDKEITILLCRILLSACVLNSKFLEKLEGTEVHCQLEFDREWGLGSSSTLIHNVAEWAGINSYDLLQRSMGGSGYDIACASADGPLLYQLKKGQPSSTRVEFDPAFKDELCFVYLGRKQKSSEAIEHYRKHVKQNPEFVHAVSSITKEILGCTALEEFERLMIAHEELLSDILQLPRVQEQFPDYPGVLKSLGAWGGDFILATRAEVAQDYFKKKGLTPVIPFSEMIL